MRRRTWMIGSAAVLGAALIGGAAIAAEEAAPAPGGGSNWAQAEDGRPRHPLAAFLGQPFRRFMTGQVGRLLVLRSEVDLTPAQRAQLKVIVEGHRTEINQVVRELATEHRALRDSVLAEKSDEKAVRAAAGEMSKGIGDAAVLIAKVRAEAWPVLTPDQRHAIDTFRVDTDKALDQFLTQLGQAPGVANP